MARSGCTGRGCLVGRDGTSPGSAGKPEPALAGSRRTANRPAEQRGLRFTCLALAFDPTGAYVALATVAGDVWVKYLQTSRSFRLDCAAMGSARSLAISPDGAVLAVAGKDAFVRMCG